MLSVRDAAGYQTLVLSAVPLFRSNAMEALREAAFLGKGFGKGFDLAISSILPISCHGPAPQPAGRTE